ncbi:hypothetical protein MSAN_02323500 [Mycena sanguinolenta]|uniref:Uncharacterized protein n=1 Tax=Mycena sanguinolenta TaxID=230812 RepID=A0A8H6X7H2_9AGAR|nr:hypothetical protein MSAN_02323500 [Mycena sanguinolenta]
MASSSSGTSYIPPLPQRPKITSAGDHWLHSSFATGDINPADLAPKVAVWASGTPTPDPQHSERLTQFFSRIATFNKTAFSQLDSLDANKAFTLLGHGSLTNIGITNVKSEPRTFAVCAFAAVKLADMLAWAADPSNAASPAVASPLPDQMSGGDGLLRRDWVEGMKHAYATFEASPGVFKPPGPAKKDNINFRASDHPVLKVLGCSTRKRFSQFTNLHTFVYMIQVFLDYGPYLDKKTIRTIIAEYVLGFVLLTPLIVRLLFHLSSEAARAKAHYSDDQMKILVKTFEAVKLCQPLLYAFSHFPAALLTSFPSISQRSTEALTSSLARGTAHFVDPESSLSKINRLFLRLALNAALSKGSTTDAIPGTFFEDPDFDKALQIPVDDTQTRGVLRFPHAIEVKPDPPHPSVAQGASIAGMSASVTAQPNGASLDTLPDSDSPGRSAIQDNPTALPRSPSPGRSADATGASSPTELTGDADNDHIPVDESMQSDSAKADASHPISADVPHPDPSGNAPIESNLSAPQPSPPPGPSADATGASSPTEITRDAGSDHVPVDENMQVDSAEADASLPISADMPHSDPPGDAPIESSLSAPQPSPPSGPSADASGASPPQALAGSDNPPRPTCARPTTKANPAWPTFLILVCPPQISDANRPRARGKGKRKASASIPRDGRKRHHSDRKQALSADERTVAWASHEGIPQHVREPQVLLHEFQDSANHLDPTLTYPLASGKRNEVTIEYYIFRHDVRDEGQLLVASKHAQPYKWVPFKGHEKQARTFRKMIASQPMGTLDNGMNVPLHVHPSAQLFHSSGLTHDAHGQPLKSDIVPGPNQSMFYVAPEERFNSLTGVQRDHLLGQRGILLVHAQPQCRLRAGVEAGFNLQTFMEFTDPTRLAHVHDLGACKPAEVPPNKAARPIDLLISARLREEGSCSRQRLNLLSNPLGHKSMPLPAAPLARVDVTSANGLVDLLALRSFVVLYLPLCSWLYPHMTKDGIMLVPSELLQEIEYAWSLTAKLDTFLSAQYRLQAITEGEIAVPDNFVEAADDCLCTMAASLLRYQVECHKIPEVRKEWPEGFDEPTFQELLLQAVARFYLHREQVNSPKSSPNAHGSNTEVERASVPLYQRLQALIEEEDDALFLLKWNPRTIPFILQPIQPPLSL